MSRVASGIQTTSIGLFVGMLCAADQPADRKAMEIGSEARLTI
jgi:hypothetical protein